MVSAGPLLVQNSEMSTLLIALIVKPLVLLVLFSFTTAVRILIQRKMPNGRLKRIFLIKLR